jgi:two-component system sensor histidine kinase TctE
MPSLREQRSLFGEILDWMLAPLLLLWPMSVALTWLVAQSIANRPYDRELADSLRALSKQVAVASVQRDVPVTTTRSLLSTRQPSCSAGRRRRDIFPGARQQGRAGGGDADLPVPVEGVVPSLEVRFRDDVIRETPVRVAYVWLRVECR